MKALSVVGARPQFVKAAPLTRALRERHEEVLVHSGQHYDYDMSQVFFEELGIPAPDFNLGVGSGGHGRMTGEMLGLLEQLMLEQEPDVVIVYGDTNTTLAGGLAAAKLHIPVAHVEAGLRIFDKRMPEEVNRVLVDHVSEILLVPTEVGERNLAREGVTEGVHVVGDVMMDTVAFVSSRADVAEVTARYGVTEGRYYLGTLHRAATSDDPIRLEEVVEAFSKLDLPVLWALHPRTRKNLEAAGLMTRVDEDANIRAVPPVPYHDTIGLLKGASALLTDSGGMQKEAYFLRVPCVTLREETEWVETVELGWNRLVGTDEPAIVEAAMHAEIPDHHPPVYGDGRASARCVAAIETHLGA